MCISFYPENRKERRKEKGREEGRKGEREEAGKLAITKWLFYVRYYAGHFHLII